MKDSYPVESQIFCLVSSEKKGTCGRQFTEGGWQGEQGCVLCLDDFEMVDHLFAECEVNRLLLDFLIPNKKNIHRCPLEASRLKWGPTRRNELAQLPSLGG